jgi:Ni,Fe-hydrogenase III small subunit/NAD-dependent dihydropyrimidine dehydrogenase PreA subunit
MLDLFDYIIKQGKATQKVMFPNLDDAVIGMPSINTNQDVSRAEAMAGASVCPTDAIQVTGEGAQTGVLLDRGRCIACGLCMQTSPSIFTRDLSTKTATRTREELILSNAKTSPTVPTVAPNRSNIFRQSLAVRVVSTGCSACDAEIGAAGNPIFDMDRFGISVVASPRGADALMVTGPVGDGMKDALKRAYEAMPEPRIVIACGTCAISGGVHANGYAHANGVSDVLPVDVFIPGCPPHPWNILHGLLLAMGRV